MKWFVITVIKDIQNTKADISVERKKNPFPNLFHSLYKSTDILWFSFMFAEIGSII